MIEVCFASDLLGPRTAPATVSCGKMRSAPTYARGRQLARLLSLENLLHVVIGTYWTRSATPFGSVDGRRKPSAQALGCGDLLLQSSGTARQERERHTLEVFMVNLLQIKRMYTVYHSLPMMSCVQVHLSRGVHPVPASRLHAAATMDTVHWTASFDTSV